MNGLTRDTWAEARDRKMLFVFGAVTAVFAIVALLLPKIDINVQTNDAVTQGLFQSTLMTAAVWVFSFFLTIMFFIAVMSTAGLIPSMFQRGRAEYYLSKPIGRQRLLLGKFVSIWLVYGLMVTVCGIILITVMSLVHGIFSWSMVWVLVAELVSFFIWMSIVLVAGVWSGSYAIAVVSAFSVWITTKIIASAAAFQEFLKDSVLRNVIDALYYILPKTGEITDIGDNLAKGMPVESWMPVYSSVIFAFAMIVMAVVVFQRRDY